MADISVDQDFARFGGKSYAINKITSIAIREVRPFKSDGGILLGMGAIAVLIFGISHVSEGLSTTGTCALLAAVMALAAWSMWNNSQIVDYHLLLVTSSAEFQAYSSRDPDEITHLRDRIEAAVAGKL